MLPILIVPAVLLVLLLLRTVRVAPEWRRVVVLRLGRFQAVRGPGLYILLPVLDTIAMTIDMRIQTTSITAEQALTRDTVAVGVDAIVFWQVEDPRAAAINIASYAEAIERVSQTSLREMIGASDLSRLLSDRRSADEQLRVTIAGKTNGWGVGVRSVEIRDVAIPASLQDAMSRQAQAEREKSARVTLASAEQEIARQVLEAAAIYAGNPVALQLRQMNLLYEMNKDRGVTVLVPTEMAAALGVVARGLAQYGQGSALDPPGAAPLDLHFEGACGTSPRFVPPALSRSFQRLAFGGVQRQSLWPCLAVRRASRRTAPASTPTTARRTPGCSGSRRACCVSPPPGW